MNEGELSILIKLMSDTVGAEQANRVMAKFKDETASSGKEVEKHNISHRDMHRLMHELNHIAPGLGMALRTALNPEAIGIVATLVLVQKVVEHFKEVKAKAEEAAKAVREVTVEAWKGHQDTINKSTESLNKYHEALVTIGKQQDHIEESMKTALAISKELGGGERQALEIKRKALAEEDKRGPPLQKRAAEAAEAARLSPFEIEGTKQWLAAHPLGKLLEEQAQAKAATSVTPGILTPGVSLHDIEERRKAADAEVASFHAAAAAVKKHDEQESRLVKARDEAIGEWVKQAELVRKMNAELYSSTQILAAKEIHGSFQTLSKTLGLFSGATNVIDMITERLLTQDRINKDNAAKLNRNAGAPQ